MKVEAMRDGGPIYRETNMAAFIKEPLNMVTAFLFAALAVYWVVRLHRRRTEHRFQYFVNYGLLIGGIGGTLFHGFRLHFIFLAMDFLPIIILAIAAALRYWFKVLPRRWHAVFPLIFILALRPVLFWSGLPRATLIGISYASLGLFIISPMIVYVAQRQFTGAKLIGLSILCFFAALWFRTFDWSPVMAQFGGGHWLWHIFGLCSVAVLQLFMFRDAVRTFPAAK